MSANSGNITRNAFKFFIRYTPIRQQARVRLPMYDNVFKPVMWAAINKINVQKKRNINEP